MFAKQITKQSLYITLTNFKTVQKVTNRLNHFCHKTVPTKVSLGYKSLQERLSWGMWPGWDSNPPSEPPQVGPRLGSLSLQPKQFRSRSVSITFLSSGAISLSKHFQKLEFLVAITKKSQDSDVLIREKAPLLHYNVAHQTHYSFCCCWGSLDTVILLG